MTNRLLGIAILVAGTASLAVAAGCGDDSASSTGDADCSTVKGYAELQTTAFSKCTNCHSASLTGAARNAAPVGSDYDTYEGAKQQAEQAPPRDLVSRVNDGTMPQPGFPQLQGTEKQDIITWAECGTPP